MVNIEWTKLNHLQVGRFGEHYAKMIFTANGFDVYSSEVDNHGVDFIAKNNVGEFLEVQVKTICKTSYMFIKKERIVLDDKHIVALIILKNNKEPEMFVFPASVWKEPNDVFKDRNYNEWGFNYSKKNRRIFIKYLWKTYLPTLQKEKTP